MPRDWKEFTTDDEVCCFCWESEGILCYSGSLECARAREEPDSEFPKRSLNHYSAELLVQDYGPRARDICDRVGVSETYRNRVTERWEEKQRYAQGVQRRYFTPAEGKEVALLLPVLAPLAGVARGQVRVVVERDANVNPPREDWFAEVGAGNAWKPLRTRIYGSIGPYERSLEEFKAELLHQASLELQLLESRESAVRETAARLASEAEELEGTKVRLGEAMQKAFPT